MIRSLLSLCILLLLVSPATAQIVNGDFEAGGTGWTVVLAPPGGGGPWTISFPAAGGNPNGYANIHSPFGDSVGEIGGRTQSSNSPGSKVRRIKP